MSYDIDQKALTKLSQKRHKKDSKSHGEDNTDLKWKSQPTLYPPPRPTTCPPQEPTSTTRMVKSADVPKKKQHVRHNSTGAMITPLNLKKLPAKQTDSDSSLQLEKAKINDPEERKYTHRPPPRPRALSRESTGSTNIHGHSLPQYTVHKVSLTNVKKPHLAFMNGINLLLEEVKDLCVSFGFHSLWADLLVARLKKTLADAFSDMEANTKPKLAIRLSNSADDKWKKFKKCAADFLTRLENPDPNDLMYTYSNTTDRTKAIKDLFHVLADIVISYLTTYEQAKEQSRPLPQFATSHLSEHPISLVYNFWYTRVIHMARHLVGSLDDAFAKISEAVTSQLEFSKEMLITELSNIIGIGKKELTMVHEGCIPFGKPDSFEEMNNSMASTSRNMKALIHRELRISNCQHTQFVWLMRIVDKVFYLMGLDREWKINQVRLDIMEYTNKINNPDNGYIIPIPNKPLKLCQPTQPEYTLPVTNSLEKSYLTNVPQYKLSVVGIQAQINKVILNFLSIMYEEHELAITKLIDDIPLISRLLSVIDEECQQTYMDGIGIKVQSLLYEQKVKFSQIVTAWVTSRKLSSDVPLVFTKAIEEFISEMMDIINILGFTYSHSGKAFTHPNAQYSMSTTSESTLTSSTESDSIVNTMIFKRPNSTSTIIKEHELAILEPTVQEVWESFDAKLIRAFLLFMFSLRRMANDLSDLLGLVKTDIDSYSRELIRSLNVLASQPVDIKKLNTPAWIQSKPQATTYDISPIQLTQRFTSLASALSSTSLPEDVSDLML